jgi:hypothetical protein
MSSEHPSGFRTNLPFILSITAAIGVVVVSLLPRFAGWQSWGLRVLAIILAGFGPVATQMEKRRAEDAQRFKAEVTVDPGTIAAFPDLEDIISEWTTAERARCLESLTEWETRQARPNEKRSFRPDASSDSGLTRSQQPDLAEQQRNREGLTAEEGQILRLAQDLRATAIAPLLKSLFPLGTTERRAPSAGAVSR